jgi:diguanylate cyclase (GGDEF)-like protein
MTQLSPTRFSGRDPDSSDLVDRVFMITERIVVFDGIDDVFAHIVKTAVTLTRADAAAIWVFDFDTGMLNIVKSCGLSDGFVRQPALHVGEGISGTVVHSGEPFASTDVQRDAASNAEFARAEGVRSLLCVPMKTRSNTIGCLTVYRKSGQGFVDHDLLLLSIFAAEAVDAVEKARLIAELKAQASLDSLTGLYNKRALLQTLSIETARCQRHAQPLAVLFIDLDNFKPYNDAHGHLMGDKLIHDFSRLIREHCRKIDIVGRFGGDEFIIVAPQTDRVGALALAEKIQQAVQQHTFLCSRADQYYHATCSIGIALLPEHARSGEELLARADEALYASKRSGKGCTTLWHAAALPVIAGSGAA